MIKRLLCTVSAEWCLWNFKDQITDSPDFKYLVTLDFLPIWFQLKQMLMNSMWKCWNSEDDKASKIMFQSEPESLEN